MKIQKSMRDEFPWTYLWTIGVVLGLAAFSGCKKVDTANSTTATGPGLTVGKVDDAKGFVVQANVVDSDLKHYFHEASSLTAPCQISQASVDAYHADPDPAKAATLSKVDLYCILDVAELDLYFNKLQFVVNVPTSMCQYAEVNPFSFYQYFPGNSAFAPHNCTADQTNGVYTGQCNGGGSQYIGRDGSGVATVGLTSTSGVPTCPYDYSLANGPNCCEGSYSVAVTVHNADTTTSSGIVEGLYTGKRANCLAGPGMDTQAKTIDGYPRADLYRAEGVGLSKSYEIAAPITKSLYSDLFVANFYNPQDFDPRIFGGAASGGITSVLPDGGGVDHSHSPRAAYQRFYEFGCLDRAEDYAGRIRVLVRSWDTVTGFPSADPYSVGSTGDNAGSAAEPGTFGPFHDRSVWKDVHKSPNYDYIGLAL